MRLITPAESWQLAARIVAAYDGPMGDIGWGPPTVTAAVLALAGELSEHLREPADVRAVGDMAGGAPRGPRRQAAGLRAEDAGQSAGPGAAAAAGGPVRRGEGRPRGARPRRSDGAGRPDRVPPSAGGPGRAGPLPGCPAGRVPGHQPRAAGPAAGAVRRRPSGHRRRRPVPVHLRLARRQRGEPAPLRPGLPGAAAAAPARCRGPSRAGAAAVDELPQRRAGPGHRGGAAGAAPGRGAGRAAPGARTGPGRTRPGGLRPARHDRRRSHLGRRADRRAAGPAAGHRARRRALAGRQPRPGPAVRHRRTVPQAVPVPRAAPGARSPWHPRRSGGARRPAHGARGTGRGGDAPCAERCGRLRRARPAAHRAALADRPAGPGSAGPPRPIARQVGPGPVGQRGRAIASRPRTRSPRRSPT